MKTTTALFTNLVNRLFVFKQSIQLCNHNYFRQESPRKSSQFGIERTYLLLVYAVDVICWAVE
jgi:hypothetical protein